MISAKDIRRKAERKYIPVLKELLAGEEPFPLILSGTGIGLKIPFRERMKGIRALEVGMEKPGSPGYRLHLEERNTRSEGRQSILKHVYFDDRENFFAYLGRRKEAEELERDARSISEALPELRDWVRASPVQIIRRSGEWEALISVLLYFRDRETEGLYLREVPVELPTKFVEQNESLLRELLDIVLPEERIDRSETDLSLRYGLKKDRDFRFRILIDPADSSLAPFRDLAVLPEELALWRPSARTVLIVENKLSFLRVPAGKGVLKIWGCGKSAVLLRECEWLAEKEVLYWGDLDPQGFEILSMVRAFLPRCRSVCMDIESFRRHESFAVRPDSYQKRNDLLLDADEYKIYNHLTGLEKGRLEQERLPLDYVEECIAACIEHRGKDK